MKLIDSHCHLDFHQFDPDRDAVIRRAFEAGVKLFINPSTDLAVSRRVIALAEEFSDVYAAIGFHPTEAGKFNNRALDALRDLAKHPKVVAIGEIGLDYYWDKAPRSVQRNVFGQQLALARAVKKPVIVHQRDAVEDTMSILREWIASGPHPGLVLHSFSGDEGMAAEAVQLGFYLGISGPITFKNARKLREIVQSVSPANLLVETDAPFLSPHPNRGQRNEPASVTLIVQRIAELHQCPVADLAARLTDNTRQLFQLPAAF
jgi:TatD DNase family protein